MKKLLLICIIPLLYSCVRTVEPSADLLIVNGVPWYDDAGNIVNSHGSCIIEDGGRYWLFGEYKSDTTNAFPGFGCYSSDDLVHWTFEKVVLPVQEDGLLGPDRIGERVKVMKCPSTGDYVMLMHTDNLAYTDPCIGIARSASINGDYEFLGPLLFNDQPIRKWDMGTFQDDDGAGYLLIHHGLIYKLSDNYLEADELVLSSLEGSGESPAMFREGDNYYLLYSNLTSWERNDNYYYISSSLAGPWEYKGLFCPEGSLTYNSQCSYVFTVKRKGQSFPIYMGDRWSYPRQNSCATNVWLPICTDGESMSIPEYWQAWNPATWSEADLDGLGVFHAADWLSDLKGSTFIAHFHGEKIAIKGITNSNGGYARLQIIDGNGNAVIDTSVDFYSLVQAEAYVYLSPDLPLDDYTLVIGPDGDSPVWFDKRGRRYGSNGSNVHLTGYLVD